MAITSVVLDIKTNTERALNDFKRFSSQLDNKFLVSGLKLDVVRSALGQINREFQKAIGEQGLTAGQSLRAAQNQASLLTQTFKSFSSTASAEMAQQFSSAFSQIAVTAGGTAQDIQKALAATPFISTDLSEDMRKALGDGLMQFQRDFRRAGVTDDFGGIAKQFLAGKLSAKQMMESGDAGQNFIGNQLMKSTGGTIDTITNAKERSKAVLDAFKDPKFQKQLSEMAKSTSGFKSIIEDLNSTLFNPEAGIFGSLRKVAMSIKDKTTVFDETRKLIESVFGREGLFVNFFKQIGKIFGIEDPLKVIIIGIRFITKQFDALNRFIQSQAFQDIIKKIREVFNVIKDFFTRLYDQVIKDFGDPTSLIGQVKQIGIEIGEFFEQLYTTISTGDWDPASAVADIKKVGQAARKFIEQIGKSFRDLDVEKQGSLFLEIFKTMVAEVAQTLGTAIKEAILSVFSGKGGAVFAGVLTTLYEGLSKFFAGLFGGNQGAGAALGGAAMAALGVLFVRRIRGALESVLRPIQALRTGGGGALGFANRLFGGGGRGGGDLDPSARGPSSMLGTAQNFYRQVIFYLQRISACVCGPLGGGGGGGGVGDGGRDPITGKQYEKHDPNAKRKAPITRPQVAPITRPQVPGSIGLPSIEPYSGYGKRDTNFGINRPTQQVPRFETPGGVYNSNMSYDRRRQFDELSLKGKMGGWGVDLEDGLYSRPDYLEHMEKQRRKLGGSDLDIQTGGGDTRGFRGTVGKRARIGRFGGRMGRLGKGALLVGGLTLGAAVLGAGSAFGGTVNPTQPEVEQPQVGAGEAFGKVGMGAAEGAMAGAMLGPWGAVIGGVIGGGVALMDKGVRDTVFKSIGQFATNMGNNTKKLWDGLLSNVMKTFDGIKSFAGSIDWKKIILDTILPGRAIARSIAQASGVKPSGENGGGPSGWVLDRVAEIFGREVGGPVIKGSSYIVGERGPEIFTPGASGSISTNRDLMAMRSGGGGSISASFNIAINVNGAMGSGDVEALRGPVLRIVEEAWASATQGTISRGVVG